MIKNTITILLLFLISRPAEIKSQNYISTDIYSSTHSIYFFALSGNDIWITTENCILKKSINDSLYYYKLTIDSEGPISNYSCLGIDTSFVSNFYRVYNVNGKIYFFSFNERSVSVLSNDTIKTVNFNIDSSYRLGESDILNCDNKFNPLLHFYKVINEIVFNKIYKLTDNSLVLYEEYETDGLVPEFFCLNNNSYWFETQKIDGKLYSSIYKIMGSVKYLVFRVLDKGIFDFYITKIYNNKLYSYDYIGGLLTIDTNDVVYYESLEKIQNRFNTILSFDIVDNTLFYHDRNNKRIGFVDIDSCKTNKKYIYFEKSNQIFIFSDMKVQNKNTIFGIFVFQDSAQNFLFNPVKYSLKKIVLKD